ncbi:hypothetical protein PspYZU08_11 [Pseudomonas phage PspYZU08]|uniref:Uncharacterized protein n=1 Tax=Pseudomonas phage PspYZU08 TaxID=1983557 RepID=A0A2U7NN63_9CAUD|nr:hypothetical protein HOT35_gp11 [Pseudomonas phage PspYZU08]ASD52187.1 hypothetical protein PspYZU08_11 [Pseudomonas phage PspYZU08]
MTALTCTIRTTSSMLNKRTLLVVSEAQAGDRVIPMGRWIFDIQFLMSHKGLSGSLEERIEQTRLMQQGVAEESLRRVLANVANKKKEA